MGNLIYIKERFCQFKCPYKDGKHEIKIGTFQEEFDCDKCGETNTVDTNHTIWGLCEYCQINHFIEEIKNCGINI